MTGSPSFVPANIRLKITSEYITTSWTVVRGFFAREQHLLHRISKLEKSLQEAGWRNQQERIAYNTLNAQYEQLYSAYQKLLEAYQSLESCIDDANVLHHDHLCTLRPDTGSGIRIVSPENRLVAEEGAQDYTDCKTESG